MPHLDAESIDKPVIDVFPKSTRERAGDQCEPPFTLGEATRAERTFNEVLLLIVLTRRYVVEQSVNYRLLLCRNFLQQFDDFFIFFVLLVILFWITRSTAPTLNHRFECEFPNVLPNVFAPD